MTSFLLLYFRSYVFNSNSKNKTNKNNYFITKKRKKTRDTSFLTEAVAIYTR